MAPSDRIALVLDPSADALGSLPAPDLAAQGIEVLSAADEAALAVLARERRAQVAAVVVPGELPLARIGGALACVRSALPGGSAAAVVVGPPRQRALLAGLRDLGVRWVVFAPHEASELRFAVAAAVMGGDLLDPRRGLRVPIRLPASLRCARETHCGEVTELSLGGAFVALEAPAEPGTSLTLEFPIGERLLRTQALVVHRREGCPPSSGIGIAFSGLPSLEARLLEGFVRERIDSFRL